MLTVTHIYSLLADNVKFLARYFVSTRISYKPCVDSNGQENI